MMMRVQQLLKAPWKKKKGKKKEKEEEVEKKRWRKKIGKPFGAGLQRARNS